MKLTDIGRNVFIFNDGTREVFAQELLSDKYSYVEDFFRDLPGLSRFESQMITNGKLRKTLWAERQLLPYCHASGSGGSGGLYYCTSATNGPTWTEDVFDETH